MDLRQHPRTLTLALSTCCPLAPESSQGGSVFPVNMQLSG